MKIQIILTTVLFFSFNILIASNIEDNHSSIIDNDMVTMTLEFNDHSNLFEQTQYKQSENCITMQFQKKIDMIQVFDLNGEIEMMLPVSSTKVNLGLSLFESATYKLGFIIEGESKIHYANISIN